MSSGDIFATTVAGGFKTPDRRNARAGVPAERMASVSVESTPVRVGVPEVEDPVVEQAKGILAVMFAITTEEALLIMQAFAGVEYPTLPELAAHVVAVATQPPGGPDVARERLTLLLFAPDASASVVPG